MQYECRFKDSSNFQNIIGEAPYLNFWQRIMSNRLLLDISDDTNVYNDFKLETRTQIVYYKLTIVAILGELLQSGWHGNRQKVAPRYHRSKQLVPISSSYIIQLYPANPQIRFVTRRRANSRKIAPSPLFYNLSF